MGQILAKGDPIIVEKPAKASESIKAGMLLEVSSGEWAKHTTAGGNMLGGRFIAKEVVNVDLDTAFADGTLVPAIVLGPGVEVNALIKAGETLVKDVSLLESGDNGVLQVHTAGDEGLAILHERVVGVAAESKTVGLSAERARVRGI